MAWRGMGWHGMGWHGMAWHLGELSESERESSTGKGYQRIHTTLPRPVQFQSSPRRSPYLLCAPCSPWNAWKSLDPWGATVSSRVERPDRPAPYSLVQPRAPGPEMP
jgi:hypothetical protein